METVGYHTELVTFEYNDVQLCNNALTYTATLDALVQGKVGVNEMNDIEYRVSSKMDVEALSEFFKEEEWNDFLELDEVRVFLDSSLYIVSAWDKNALVGIGRLGGDGRIQVEITDVVVKSDYQSRGIGTEIVSRLVSFIDEAAPYFVQVSPVGEKEVRLYEKFGFVVMPDYIRMERSTSKLREKIGAVRNRK